MRGGPDISVDDVKSMGRKTIKWWKCKDNVTVRVRIIHDKDNT